MRSHRHMIAGVALAALASPAFLGAQKRVVTDDVERPLSFDPLAILRRPPRKVRQRWGGGAHVGGKQIARDKARMERSADYQHNINQHYDARMRWNETVYPRVLERQEKQRERSRG